LFLGLLTFEDAADMLSRKVDNLLPICTA